MAYCPECAMSTCPLTSLWIHGPSWTSHVKLEDLPMMYCLWAFNPLAGDKSPLSRSGTGMFPQQVVRALFLAARALEA